MADDVYQSRSPGYQIIVQGAEPIYAPGTGILIDRQKELIAEFGRFGPEITRRDSETGEPLVDEWGQPMTSAVIQGHVFDLQQQAEEKGWTDEEAELVRKKVDWACRQNPAEVWLRSKPKATAPWPAYDSTHHSQIAKTAEITGTLTAALKYEQENKKRPSVVDELEAALKTTDAAADLVAS